MDKKNYRFSMVATDSGKTRISCSRCRKKNMVCDKLMPSCTNCLKRGLNCSYPLRKQWTRRESQDFDRKEKESKKRQKRMETDHGTKKKKMTDHPISSNPSEFEDVSSWLSSTQKGDPLLDAVPSMRSASENAMQSTSPSHASSSASSSVQTSPLNFNKAAILGTSPLTGPRMVTNINNANIFNTSTSPGVTTTTTNVTLPPIQPSGEFGRARANSDLPRISAIDPNPAPELQQQTNPEVGGQSPIGGLASGEYGRARAMSSAADKPRLTRGGGISPTLGKPCYHLSGQLRHSSSGGFGRPEIGGGDTMVNQAPLRPQFPPLPNPETISPVIQARGEEVGGGDTFMAPLRPKFSPNGKVVSPVISNNSLPPLREVLEGDTSKGASSDFFADANKNISSPAYNTPTSPSVCSPSPSFSGRNDSQQLPLSPLSSLTISSQPPSHPFFLSSMMNSTFPPPSNVQQPRSHQPSPPSGLQTTTPTHPPYTSHLPPILPSSSLSPPSPSPFSPPLHFGGTTSSTSTSTKGSSSDGSLPPNTLQASNTSGIAASRKIGTSNFFNANPPLAFGGTTSPISTKGCSSDGSLNPLQASNASAMASSRKIGTSNFFNSDPPLPFGGTPSSTSTREPRQCSSDGTLANKEGSSTITPPANSKASWSGSAPAPLTGAEATSPPPEEEVITAQEHAFFEEMGWLTLSKDKAPEPGSSTPTTAVVRDSLSDETYQAQLVEKSSSPMVSMYFGAYKTCSGDIRVQIPRFVAKNRLAQKEFYLKTSKSLKGQYHPVSQRRVFDEMRSRYVAPPDQVVQEVRFGILIDDRKGNWIEYATCANYFYGAEGLLTYITRTFVKCSPSPTGPSIDYLMRRDQEGKDEEKTAQEDNGMVVSK